MGLLGGMARTAVVAGTATAVSNRVSRRQARKWSGRGEPIMQPYEQQQAPPQYQQPPPQYHYHDHDIDWDDDWDHSDAAVGFVVGAATGALVNEALQPDVVTTEITTASAPAPVAVTRLPCSPASSLVGGVTYYRCGSTYYVQAYTQGGLLYVPVAPP